MSIKIERPSPFQVRAGACTSLHTQHTSTYMYRSKRLTQTHPYLIFATSFTCFIFASEWDAIVVHYDYMYVLWKIGLKCLIQGKMPNQFTKYCH